MAESDIKHGMIVTDRVSGFTGVVTMIGDHITGCTRYCVHPTDVASHERGSQEFFYASQLEIIEEDSDFTDEGAEAITESDVRLGQLVEDTITGFSGIVDVINYNLWNCPSVHIQSTDDADDGFWCDDMRLEAVSDEIKYDFDDVVSEESQNEHNTGAGSDTSSRSLAATPNLSQ